METLSIIQTLENIDVKILLAVNGANNALMDAFMFAVSDKFIWIPLYLVLLYFTWKYYKIKGIWVALAFIAAVSSADLSSVHLFKNEFQRYRPCHNLDLQHLIHLVHERCGGRFGFVSSHAANTAAVATVGILFFRKHVKWMVWVLLAYTLLNCYSRVYLGVHYPSDVVGGFLLGVTIGVFWFLAFFKIFLKKRRIKT